MAKLITILLLFISQFALAQFRQNSETTQTPRTDIIKYDFNTYTGTPIKTGWLFDDATYKKLYVSYNAADSLLKAFDQYDKMIQQMNVLNSQVVSTYETRIKEKDDLNKQQEEDIKKLNELINSSNDNVKKFEKQFIKVGNIRIHKGTAFKVGVSALVMGWLIGKF